VAEFYVSALPWHPLLVSLVRPFSAIFHGRCDNAQCDSLAHILE
jgi:hypothetical protein